MINRAVALTIMLVVLIANQCLAAQPRIADIGAEMFRQKFMENNKNFVSKFLPKESAQNFVVPKFFSNGTSYVFYTCEERNGIILYSNQDGYLEAVIVIGYVTSTTRHIQLLANAMKTAMSLGLDDNEISWLFSKGHNSDGFYTGVVHCKSSNKDIYLMKGVFPNGLKLYLFDYEPASMRFRNK